MLNAFTGVFLAALAAATATRLWLAARQVRHVRAHRAQVPAAFAESIPLGAHEKAADYTVAKTRLGMAGTILDAALLLAFTLGGGVQWVGEQWQRALPAPSIWHDAVVIITVLTLLAAAHLPVNAFRTFGIEERFGFNRMTWKLFVADLAKGVALAAVLGVPLLLAVLWLAAQAGAFWWLWVWGVLVAFSAAMQLIFPVFILPLFNKFSPLEDPALAERVKSLLERCGFRSKGLYVMDGSKRSAHGNAFFTGFGAGKRIVLFDTLVARLTPAEVEAVLAHELGHYKLNHVKKGLAVGWITTLAELALLGFLATQPWFYEGLGVQTQTLPVALLLFLLVSSTFGFFLSPLWSLLSRRHEFEADVYARRHSAAEDLVRALVKLYKDNAATLTPDPLHSAFYDSHPPAAARIARLRTA
jgi:STE24 endopeptidase